MAPIYKTTSAAEDSTLTATSTADAGPNANAPFIPSAEQSYADRNIDSIDNTEYAHNYRNNNGSSSYRNNCNISRADACHYSPHGANGRFPYYLAVRWTNVVLALVLLALAMVAEFHLHRGTWVNPILTPSMTTMGWSLGDLFRVYRYNRRAHPHFRIGYDGVAQGTGLAVASGFLTAWIVNDKSSEIGHAVPTLILLGMYLMATIQFSIGYGGVRQLMLMRRGMWRMDM